ncbi:MAG: hypothetical protein GXY76_10790 [Chloroflexi bacterium]|nr:hypothetical protein [Chloroflexota bacterium]
MGNPLQVLANWLQSSAADAIGLWVAAILTLIVYSYLFADSGLFRLAQYLFVGVAAGYAVIQAWHGALLPRIQAFIAAPQEHWTLIIWLVLGLLLFVRKVPALRWFSKIPVAYLIGVGAALALGGALVGAILPQVSALFVSLSPRDYGGGQLGIERAISQGLLAVGTLGTLLYFYFTSGGRVSWSRFWNGFARGWGRLGKWVILITLGALFGGTVMSRISLLLGRLQFLAGDWLGLIP